MKKILKKTLAVFIAVIMTFGSAPLNGFVGLELPDWLDFSKLFAVEAEAAVGGSCGVDATWSLDFLSGTLTISGTGYMTNWGLASDRPWDTYDDRIYYVVVENGITGIGKFSFASFTKAESISIPDTVCFIGNHAFSSCVNVERFSLPDGLTYIGDYAFENCSAITSISIPDNVTYLGDYAFESCKNLKTVSLGNNIEYIGKDAFSFCSSVTSVSIPGKVNIIGERAFYWCTNLAEVTIGNGVKEIGNDAFGCCYNLKTIIIPDSVEKISDGAFNDCKNLTSVTLGKGLVSIGYHAFSDCTKIESIIVPDNITSLGEGAFYRCRQLSSVKIGKGITSISDDLFFGCYALKDVELSDSVTSIGNSAFNYCEGLENIIIPYGVTAIGKSAFSNCISLLEIVIPNSVTVIGDHTFYNCDSLTSVTIPENVEIIESYAFLCCDNLKSMTIHNSVTSIGEEVVDTCKQFTDVYFIGTKSEWNQIEIDKDNAVLLNATIHYLSTNITFEKNEYYIGLGYEFAVNGEIASDIDEINQSEFTFKISDSSGVAILYDSINAADEDKSKFIVGIEGLKEGTYTLTASDGTASASCFINVVAVSEIELKIEKTDDVYYVYNRFLFNQFGDYAENAIKIDVQLLNKLKDDIDLSLFDEKALDSADIENVKFTTTISGGYSLQAKESQRFLEKKYDVFELDKFEEIPLKIYWTDDAPETLKIEYKLFIGDEIKYQEDVEIKIVSYMKHYVDEHATALSSPEYSTLLNVSFARNMMEIEDSFSYKWNMVVGRSLFSNVYDLIDGDLSEQMAYEMLLADLVGRMYDDETVSAKSIEIFGNEYTSISNKIVDVLVDYCKHYEPDLYKILDEIGDGDLYSLALAAIMRGETDNDFARIFNQCLKSTVLRNNIKSSLNIISATDKLADIFDAVGIVTDTYNGCIKAFNLVSAMNTFVKMDKEIVSVLEKMLFNCGDNLTLQRAIISFIEYYNSDDRVADIANEFRKSNMDVITQSAWTTLKMVYKDSVKEAFVKGLTELFGETVSENAVAVIGGALVGYELGSLLSNLLCNTKNCSEKMARVVAIGEFSGVLKDTITGYRMQLNSSRDYQLARELDMALNLYVESEKFAYSETIEALKAEGSSVIVNLFQKQKHDDYVELISEYCIKIAKLDTLRCHSYNLEKIAGEISKLGSGAGDGSKVEKEYKVVCVRCPVDVAIYNSKGETLAIIVNNEVEYCDEGIQVVIFEGEKYICLPLTDQYDIEITATDNGTMSYDVYEFDKNGENVRGIAYNNIKITEGQKLNASVNSELLTASSNYNVFTGNEEISASRDSEKGDKVLHEMNQIKIGSQEVIRGVPIKLNLICANLPENAKIIWSCDDESVSLKPVENGTSCEITAKKLGDINIKVDVESVSERASANKTFTIKEQDFKITWRVGKEKIIQNYEYGQTIHAPAVSSPERFVFVGWDKKVPDTMPACSLAFTAKFELSFKMSIRNPSTTTISYGDSIILHADMNEALPSGWTIKWTADNGNFTYTTNGEICTITPSKSGDTTFTATVYDENGNVISEDTQTMKSKAGFFDKFVAFFKKLFGLTKIIQQSLYTIY